MDKDAKTAWKEAKPGTAFHDPSAEGGYVPHRDNPELAPERAYQDPFGVLHDERLSRRDKRAILTAWRDKETRRLNPATGEEIDSAGGTLGAIEDALIRLG